LIFRKKKYHFNPDTLAFEKISVSRRHRIKKIILIGLICLVFTGFSGWFLNNFTNTPESYILNNQLSKLNREVTILFRKSREAGKHLQANFFKNDNYYRSILQIDTLSYSVRNAGTGGSADENDLAMQDNTVYQLAMLMNHLTLQLQIQSESLDTVFKKAQELSVRVTHMPAILPVAESDLTSISTDFGIRIDPFLFEEKIHTGLDFVAPIGKNVYATGDGIVTFVQYSRYKGYGNEIVINHAFSFGTRYGHLDTVLVKEGEFVKRGQKIGTVGETGRATGPHLHYEVLYNNKQVNPSFYFDTLLSNEEYAQILNKANKDIH
jgi:murein DD-endopeptidase MepM/ murein hydrolase activator NlpD